MAPKFVITEMDTALPETDDECPLCDEGVFVRDGYERICSHCQYSPDYESTISTREPWETYRVEVQRHARGRKDGRPRLAGGYKHAYWGDGEYEFTPSDGFSL